ncbi:efflux RND transporter periplasmic adaptor subunit [Prochlorococcus sp. MIT 1341]|uniref:efflux RND transporter periplasmic adaptor subunit n=1 Tax=Prochlorococcus sp. MIT 1341 TaxID=3096221 RepID=UPI002A74E85C|nr:efflux RND transporter periplasmic adaptor subunit [Prochlorococcus sp. MIT 1341]
MSLPISEPQSTTSFEEEVVQPLRSVAALGQLEPAGDVRRLASPVSGFGGTPRVLRLNVREGDEVKKGQVLAVFDSRPRILADLDGIKARIDRVEVEIDLKEKEVSRYEKAASQGATSLVLLEEKYNQLQTLKGLLKEYLAESRGLEVDLQDSELKTPIDGVVLRIHTQEGERSGNEGVLEVGANKIMEALIEVYESDVNRVQIGQRVELISENGGFRGTLFGNVQRISPQVRQRRVLSTDPTGDADARVVEVRISLDPKSASLVTQLTGMKVIARFQEL